MTPNRGNPEAKFFMPSSGSRRNTIFAGSVCQPVAMVGFLATQSQAGLFTVFGRVRSWLQRHHPRVCAGCARAVSGIGSVMARAKPAAVQRLGDGIWRLARRCNLRLRRVLCDGLCRWHPLQPGRIVIDAGEEIAAADCRINPREQQVLQLIRLILGGRMMRAASRSDRAGSIR
jgi:hypothetical protein